MNLSIKGVPDAIAARLRTRAARNHRSLQGELLTIISAAAAEEGLPVTTAPTVFTRRTRGWKSLAQVVAEAREHPSRGTSRAGRTVDLIRQMRDSR